jgi:hypothetical protein
LWCRNFKQAALTETGITFNKQHWRKHHDPEIPG